MRGHQFYVNLAITKHYLNDQTLVVLAWTFARSIMME